MENQKKNIAVVGTFDTKAEEFSYLVKEIQRLGAGTCVIDAGMQPTSADGIDVPNTEVAKLAGIGFASLNAMTRQDALQEMVRGLEKCVRNLYCDHKIDGIISMGGSGGTTLGTAAMKVLPVGIPKLMISTFAGSIRMANYVLGKDIMVLNPLVDISGVNTITEMIMKQAAGAIVGAANNAFRPGSKFRKYRIAASMYGLTTPGVTTAKQYLENKGYEVITFHSTGAGGRAMEDLIRSGFFDGVLDITLPEIHAHVLGSPSGSAGPDRASGAAEMGIPQVVCPGAMDMCSATDFSNFGGRVIYSHSLVPSHFRPNSEDTRKSAEFLAGQLNKSSAGCALFLPLRGLSLIDVPGKPMYDKEANNCLFETLKSSLKSHVELYELEHNVNDQEFALAMAKKLDEIMTEKYSIMPN